MQVRDEYLRAVPSETMRSFLSEKMASGEFCPSPEDMVSAFFLKSAGNVESEISPPQDH